MYIDVDSVHGLLFEEADNAGVSGCCQGLCESQCSYVGVMACALEDNSCRCPETLVCELSHRVANVNRV